jgi:hypothetical protein
MPTDIILNKHDAQREIWQLRTLIRKTRRRIGNGSLDFEVGSKLLTRYYNALAYILRTNHHIFPPRRQSSNESISTLYQRYLREAAGLPPHDDPSEDPPADYNREPDSR